MAVARPVAVSLPWDTATAGSLLAWLAETRPAWMRDAACQETPDVDYFPPKGASSAPAKAVCRRCLVSPECLAFAIENDEPGVWGATSVQERRKLRPAYLAGKAKREADEAEAA